MPQVYKNAKSRNVQDVLLTSYTCPALTQALVQSVHIAPLATAPESGAQLTVTWTDSSDTSAISNLAVLFPLNRRDPPLNLLDRPLVLEAGDTLKVVGIFPSGIVSSLCDVTVSVLEIS
jgi:hypothetical protein